jgi:hypothetical protein
VGVLVFLGVLSTINAVIASSNGAYGVEVTNSYVHVDGAKCSCSLSDGYYYHHNITFVNKCPHCGGKLAYEFCSYWVEGLWYCTSCDMDFCCVHGKEHGNMGYYLTPYHLPAPETPKKDKTISTKVLGKVQKITLKTNHAEVLGL